MIRDKADLAMLIIVGVIIAGVMVYVFFAAPRRSVKRKLRALPGSKMADLSDGVTARVSGKVIYCGATLTAPISGRKCAFYHIIIEQFRRSPRHGYWELLVDEKKSADLVITDGTCAAIIHTQSAQTHVVKDLAYQDGFFTNTNPALADYLRSQGIDPLAWTAANEAIRYQEGIIEEGETLTVAGKVRWIRKTGTPLEIPADRVLRLEPCDDEPLYFTDDSIH